MSDYIVSVENPIANTVTVQDIVNAVNIAEVGSNNVTVVAATFVNAAGASSNLFYSSGTPSDSIGVQGDFYIDTTLGQLWGPKNETSWSDDPLPLIPKRYTYPQPVAAAEWTISHNLEGFPSVTVVDSAGSIVIGEVNYISSGLITLSFQSAFSGTAYLT